ncbi:class IV lanthionine synthetase LanL [Streptomyces sp. NPDC094448]|uniref:class IV lanthionine synthetase LanL n=1 Tax=Streptomyces sp. NPDC094448 TaxID=3366063 RepID=UPI00381E8A12
MDSLDRSDGTGPDQLLTGIVRARLESRADRNRWRVIDDSGFWCRVTPAGRPLRPQGWKLHLSATPLSAPYVLARAADVLIRHRVAFKFATTVDRVRELVSRHAGRSSGGKFLTVYPECDDDRLRELAEALHQATLGLPGPGILSDRRYRADSLLHYRYGAFGGVPVLGNDGTYESFLIAPDGSLVPDQRKAWFTPPSWAPRDPFLLAGPAETPAQDPGASASRPRPGPVLLDGRYLVRGVIRHSYHGGVYRGTDRRTGTDVIIKQARPHTGAELTGSDVRDLRRHEARMLELLEPTGLSARPLGLFEQQGDLFLVQEALPGVSLRRWVVQNLTLNGDTWGPAPQEARRLAHGLAALMSAAHAQGLVLRDFNPSNVMVAPDGSVRLIDLELVARPGDCVGRAGTPGYAAPEQRHALSFGPAPGPPADLHGLGATFFYLVTGLDPVLPADEPPIRPTGDRIGTWLERLAVTNPAALQLSEIILELMREDPGRRPPLEEVSTRLADTSQPHPPPCREPAQEAAGRTEAAFTEADLKPLIADAVEYLLATMDPQDPDRLWPSGTFGATTDPFAVQHGAAGILEVLVRAYQAEPDPALRQAVTTAATWIGRHVTREPRTLPGLHFGRSGTAWALLDAGLALDAPALVQQARDLSFRIPTACPNPDVCHGASGAGLALLRFWEATGEAAFLDRARQAADTVTAAAEHHDGGIHWPVPADYPSALAGVSHYGFAHGTAGVGAFLLAAARATGDGTYAEQADAAARTLAAAAQVEDGAAHWPTAENDRRYKTHWCSGSSGIGTFLLRYWQTSGEQQYLDLAAQAAEAVFRARRHVSPAQCHGLAGDGDFLLDLAQATGDDHYRDAAGRLAACIHHRYALHHGRRLAPDETGTAVVADYATGLSGVLAFHLRLRHGGPRLWQPGLLTGHAPAATF